MPLARYFLFVGGVLLSLMFISDALLPSVPVAASTEAAADMPFIRIHSDRKWPERIVFDTSIPTITPAPVATAEANVPSPPTVADVPAKVRVREAFAQLPPEPKKPESKPQRKRKIARSRVAPPTMLVAQQPRFGFGFFGNDIW
jgi:hypothetical protein